MVDRFTSYTELARTFREGEDFRVIDRDPGRFTWLIMAPHGGKIEKGTSELARAVAADDHGLYLFEGLLPAANRDLHVTSHRFFEERLDALLGKAEFALGIHGCADGDHPETILIGGLGHDHKDRFQACLKEGGFASRISDHRLPGEHPQNTCNRCRSGKGIQLEIPLTLRLRLLDNPKVLEGMAEALRRALV